MTLRSTRAPQTRNCSMRSILPSLLRSRSSVLGVAAARLPKSDELHGSSVAAGAAAAAAAAVLAVLSAGAAADSEAHDKQSAPSHGHHKLLSLSTRQRLFFSYEKRIRERSCLEKVFSYFSSQEREGAKCMAPLDLMRALVPTYPASRSTEERAGSLDGDSAAGQGPTMHSALQHKFFQQFDLDGDGAIGLTEFLLVVTLLGIPRQDVHTIFNVVDLDGNGVIDAAEFHAIIAKLQEAASIRAPSSVLHHSIHGGVSALQPGTTSGLLVTFFGKEGLGKLRLQDFEQFLETLHHELLQLEFEHYLPDAKGCIAGVDFARSLMVGADALHSDALLDKVDAAVGELSGISISHADFRALHSLQGRLGSLRVALNFQEKLSRPVTKTELSRLVVQATGVALSDQVLTVIMAVFNNGHGNLDVHLFLETLMRKWTMWERRHGQVGSASGILSCWWGCIQRASLA